MGSMRDSLASTNRGYGTSAPASHTGRSASNADSAQVWIAPETNGRAPRSASNVTGGRRAVEDDDSDNDTSVTQSTARNGYSNVSGARQYNGGWTDQTPIEQAYPAKHRQASATSYDRFHKQGAVKETPEQRARNHIQREQQRKQVAEGEDEDDDSDEQSDGDEDHDY